MQVVESVSDEIPRDEVLVRMAATGQRCEQRQLKLTGSGKSV